MTGKNKLEWSYHESKYQKYWEAKQDSHTLFVFANKWSPDIWTAMVDDLMIFNKTRNDRIRKKMGLPKQTPLHELPRVSLLTGTPEYLMRKAEYCFRHNKTEISE